MQEGFTCALAGENDKLYASYNDGDDARETWVCLAMRYGWRGQKEEEMCICLAPHDVERLHGFLEKYLTEYHRRIFK